MIFPTLKCFVFIYLLCTCMCMPAHTFPKTHGDQRTTCQTIWIMGITRKSLDLVTCTFTYWPFFSET